MPLLYGKPLTTDEMVSQLSSPGAIERLAYSFRDWSEAITWLTELGAPNETPEGNWTSLVDKIMWVVENVDHERIKQS